VINRDPDPRDAGHDIFTGVDLGAATLAVPARAVDAYKAAREWGKFGKIVAIDEWDDR
jgi:hypothetical protein